MYWGTREVRQIQRTKVDLFDRAQSRCGCTEEECANVGRNLTGRLLTLHQEGNERLEDFNQKYKVIQGILQYYCFGNCKKDAL